jgi:hypothetical protein
MTKRDTGPSRGFKEWFMWNFDGITGRRAEQNTKEFETDSEKFTADMDKVFARIDALPPVRQEELAKISAE